MEQLNLILLVAVISYSLMLSTSEAKPGEKFHSVNNLKTPSDLDSDSQKNDAGPLLEQLLYQYAKTNKNDFMEKKEPINIAEHRSSESSSRKQLQSSRNHLPSEKEYGSAISRREEETGRQVAKKALGVFTQGKPLLFSELNLFPEGSELYNAVIRGNFGLSKIIFDRPRPLRWG